jgi:hypothetical protein
MADRAGRLLRRHGGITAVILTGAAAGLVISGGWQGWTPEVAAGILLAAGALVLALARWAALDRDLDPPAAGPAPGGSDDD